MSSIRLTLLSLLLALGSGPLLYAQIETAAHVTTIYPVGDSITAGYGPGDKSQGGYRLPLFQKLKADGIAIQFVGSSDRNSNDPELVAEKQTHHEGHGGYRIDQIFHNLDGFENGDSSFGGYWMTGGHDTGRTALEPDIILVHVGTNDILQNTPVEIVEKRLGDLLDWLATHRPQSKVFVAKILPIGKGNANETVKTLNAWLEDRLSKDPGTNNTVFLVDIYKPFIDAEGHLNHLPDGIHPDKEGYAIMATIWYQALKDAKVLSP